MFQNISKDFDEEKIIKEDVKNNKNLKAKEAVKKIFSKHMIILYIASFLLSLVGFESESNLAPFGIAILIAALANCRPIGIAGLLVCIGTMISRGATTTLNLLLVLILVFFSILLKSPKYDEDINEKRKLGLRLFISTLIVQGLPLLFKETMVYDIIFAFIYAISSYIFYKIFVNSLPALTNIGEQKAYSIEEIMGASLILAIATCSIKDVAIFGYSIKNIICILIVLIMGWKNGILVGGAAGITIGSVIGIIAGQDALLIATYALSRNDCRSI